MSTTSIQPQLYESYNHHTNRKKDIMDKQSEEIHNSFCLSFIAAVYIFTCWFLFEWIIQIKLSNNSSHNVSDVLFYSIVIVCILIGFLTLQFQSSIIRIGTSICLVCSQLLYSHIRIFIYLVFNSIGTLKKIYQCLEFKQKQLKKKYLSQIIENSICQSQINSNINQDTVCPKTVYSNVTHQFSQKKNYLISSNTHDQTSHNDHLSPSLLQENELNNSYTSWNRSLNQKQHCCSIHYPLTSTRHQETLYSNDYHEKDILINQTHSIQPLCNQDFLIVPDNRKDNTITRCSSTSFQNDHLNRVTNEDNGVVTQQHLFKHYESHNPLENQDITDNILSHSDHCQDKLSSFGDASHTSCTSDIVDRKLPQHCLKLDVYENNLKLNKCNNDKHLIHHPCFPSDTNSSVIRPPQEQLCLNNKLINQTCSLVTESINGTSLYDPYHHQQHDIHFKQICESTESILSDNDIKPIQQTFSSELSFPTSSLNSLIPKSIIHYDADHTNQYQNLTKQNLMNALNDMYIFYVPVNELIRFFGAPINGKALKLFYNKILENIHQLPPTVAADLIRLPVKIQMPNIYVTQALCNRLLQISPMERNLTSMQIALAVWSLAKSDNYFGNHQRANGNHYDTLPILNSLAEEALLRLREFQPLSIANMLWACGKLKFRHEVLLCKLGEAAVAQLDQFNAQNIANTYWSLGSLECSLTALTPKSIQQCNHGYGNPVASVLETKLPTFNSQALANFVWACAKLQWCDRPLLIALATEAANRIDEFKPQEIANIMWGFAKLGLSEASSAMIIFGNQAAATLSSFNGQEVSNAFWALGTLEIKSTGLTPMNLSVSLLSGGSSQVLSGSSSCNIFPQSSQYNTLTEMKQQHSDNLDEVMNEDILLWSNKRYYDGSGMSMATPSTIESLAETTPLSQSSINNSTVKQYINHDDLVYNKLQEKDELFLQTLLNKMKQFNSQAVANFMWACGKLQWKCQEVCNASRIIVKNNLRYFRPQNTANFLWAMAKLKFKDDKLITLLTHNAVAHLNQFNTQELANIYWAIGTLEVTDSPLTSSLENEVALTVDQWGEQKPSNDYSKLQSNKQSFNIPQQRQQQQQWDTQSKHTTRIHEQNISQLVRAKLRFFKPQEIANFLWACAKLKWKTPCLLDEATKTALRLIGGFKPQEVGNLVWALAKLNYRPVELLKAMCDYASNHIDAFTAQNIANIYWAIGSLTFSQTGLSAENPSPKFLRSLLALIKKFNDQEIANFVWACGRLRWDNKDVVDVATEVFLSHLNHFRKQDFLNLQAAFRKLGRHDVAKLLENNLLRHHHQHQQNTPACVLRKHVILCFMQPILDVRILEDFEYLLQLSFFTADLHITRAWRASNDDDDANLRAISKEISGAITTSLVELSQVEPPLSFDSVLTAKKLPLMDVAGKMCFPIGLLDSPAGFSLNPTGFFRFLLFELALGLTFEYNAKTQGTVFEKATIPRGFSSIIRDRSSQYTNNVFRHDVRVSHTRQVLPIALIEIEFKPLRIDVSIPICEYCEAEDGTVYCPADKVHLCPTCDIHQHTNDKLLSKHQRVPLSQSPNMFGPCQIHPTESANACCLTCYVPLCSQCLLIGSHGSMEYSDHQIVTAIDAYRLAVQSVSDPDDETSLELHQRNKSFSIQSVLKMKFSDHDDIDIADKQLISHFERSREKMAEILVQSDSLKSRVDAVAQKLLSHYHAIRTRKLQYCDAIERQLLTSVLQIEWAERFIHHIRGSLPSSHFLFFKRRHDSLAERIFCTGNSSTGSIIDLFQQLPTWVLQQIYLSGELRISPFRQPIPILFRANENQLPDSGSVFDSLVIPKLYFTPEEDPLEEKKPIDNGPICAEWIPFKSDMYGTHPYGTHTLDGKHLPFNELIEQQDIIKTPEELTKGPLVFATPIQTSDNTQNNKETIHSTPQTTAKTIIGTYDRSMDDTQEHLQDHLQLSQESFKYSAINTSLSQIKPSVSHPILSGTTDSIGLIDEKPKLFPKGIQPRTGPTSMGYEQYVGLPLEEQHSLEDNGMIYVGTRHRDKNRRQTPQTLWNPKIEKRHDQHVELWELLKEYRFEALIMILKTCPKSVVCHLIRYVVHAAMYMNDLINLIRVILEVEILWMSHLPLCFIQTYPSLIIPLLQHIFASNDVLIRSDRVFFERILQPILETASSAMTTPQDISNSMTEPSNVFQLTVIKSEKQLENKINYFQSIIEHTCINQLIQLQAQDIPPTIRSILFLMDKFGKRLPVIHYPKGILHDVIHGDQVKQENNLFIHSPIQPGVALCVEALLRLGLAEYIARRTVTSSLVGNQLNDDKTKAHIYDDQLNNMAVSILLKQIGQAVWRLNEYKESTRFDINDTTGLSLGSNDMEIFLLKQAAQLYRWMKCVILQHPYINTQQCIFDWTRMPGLGHQGMKYLINYIIGLDGALRRDDDNKETLGYNQFEGFTLNDLVTRTRNLDRIILVCMTMKERYLPISMTLL